MSKYATQNLIHGVSVKTPPSPTWNGDTLIMAQYNKHNGDFNVFLISGKSEG